jgi:serine/threonine protein kinase
MSQKELTLERKLGSGSYGVVFKCKTKDDKTYALKKSYKEKDKLGYSSLSELNIMKELNTHPFIVKHIKTYFEKPYKDESGKIDKKNKDKYIVDEGIYFLMELGNVTLDDYIAHKDYGLSYFESKIVMIQILIALQFFHRRNIFHRDLSSSNVVICTNKNTFRSGKELEKYLSNSYSSNGDKKKRNLPHVKIIDFGLAGFCNNYDSKTKGLVTIEFRPPEVCANSYYNEKIDVWSVGCIVYECLTGDLLFDIEKDKDKDKDGKEPNRKKILENIVNNYPCENFDIDFYLNMIKGGENKVLGIEINKKNNLILGDDEVEEFNKTPGNYNDFLDVMQSMLEIDPLKRGSAEDILSMKFFDEYKNYINEITDEHEPTNRYLYEKENPVSSSDKEEENFQIIKSNERKWGMNVFISFFNERKKIEWYNHFIIFQSMRLYDMYISYRNNESKVLREETEDVGKTGLTKENCDFYARACVFIFFKFYLKIEDYFDFNTFFPSSKKLDKEKEKRFLSFEEKVLQVTEGRIFRYGIYEYLNDNFFDENKAKEYREKEVRFLFMKYVQKEEFEQGNVKQLFDSLI